MWLITYIVSNSLLTMPKEYLRTGALHTYIYNSFHKINSLKLYRQVKKHTNFKAFYQNTFNYRITCKHNLKARVSFTSFPQPRVRSSDVTTVNNFLFILPEIF